MTFTQREFTVRCEWGEQGVRHLAPISDVVIIVDVLSFCTATSIACARGAIVYPYRWRDDSAAAFAASVNAELAGARGASGYSLSPASLTEIPRQTRLVLPSPNGATLSLAAGNTPVLAGSLRNASAVAELAMRLGRTIAVIPAGERWQPDHSLRPALEDLVGAGAVIHHLRGSLSPEARLAAAAFAGVATDLQSALLACSSGRELIERGCMRDVELSAELDADRPVALRETGVPRPHPWGNGALRKSCAGGSFAPPETGVSGRPRGGKRPLRPSWAGGCAPILREGAFQAG